MKPFQRNNRPSQASLVQLEQRFNALAQQYQAALQNNDYAKGKEIAEATLRVTPKNMKVLYDYALCLMRVKEYEKSYKTFMKVFKAHTLDTLPTNTLDGLAEVSGWLERPDDVRRYGLLSLERGDQKFSQGTAYPIPNTPPPPFNPNNPKENIIAFTLFGTDPRYCESSVMNAKLSKELFPGWTCRFYLDDSVPEHVNQRLIQEGAEVVKMEGELRQAVHPLMWRFLVMDDPQVKRYLIRDADSLLSEREQAAVNEWVKSDYWFHHMRDYFTHTELILAGLWGGCHNSAIPSIVTLVQDYLSKQAPHARFADQFFLREYMWPTVRQSLLSHDELFGFYNAVPYPAHAPIRWTGYSFHVGSNASYKPCQFSSPLADGEEQRWKISDENDVQQCEYRSVVKDNFCTATLPFFLLDLLINKTWKLNIIND